ncbi:Protein of unknown function [Cotesia congregata]|uniref:Uncharacterized protein n=1 Tax=Cotesia congregata TaxID=51543 RepID=A0A8J2MX62_COTCN|nr:Protein of unknown function [Cotesia congregata]
MKFVNHWSLSVDAMSILLKSSILQPDIYYARQCLFRFVKDIEALYGIEHVSFNVHLLTHLAQTGSNAANLQILECFRSKMAFEKLFASIESKLSAEQLKY